MKRLSFVRWLALGCLGVVVSCKDVARPDATGSIALHVIVPSEPAAGGPERSPAEPRGHLTSATATATSGTTTKTVTLTGGTGTSQFTGTITGLAPGSYTVTVQGFVGTEVDYYGQTAGVSVTANVTTTATITFQSFVPTLSALTTPTASFRPSVSFSSVSNATSYKIEFARDAGFTSPLSSTTTTTSGSIVIADTGAYYVRVRAANTTVPNGGRVSATQTLRVTTDLRASGTTFAAATNLGFGAVAAVTLDSLNIFPASDDDWFQLSECNGDSLSITAQAVRLTPASPLNSALALYSGATGRLITASGDDDSTDARVRIKLTADGTYKVRVAGTGSTVGHYRLQIQVTTGANNQGASCKVQPLAVTSLSAGNYHTCAVRAAGVVDCWGYGLVGQLGNGGTSTTSSPTRVSSSLTFTSVTVGSLHSCALTNTSAAYCWGYNFTGQLGNGSSGSSANALTPVAVSGGRTYSQLSAGDFHTCGLSGTQIYCWGSGADGRLGNGLATDQSQPVLVSGGLAFQSVAAGAGHACGLTTGGSVFCWGLNTSGQLGNGTLSNSSMPVAVSGGLLFVELGVGAFHSCARTSGGAVNCWGQNDIGQLGNGTTTNATTPVLVSGALLFTRVSGGRFHTCGLASGTAYCWGNNYDGQIGDGTNAVRVTPVPVSAAFTFTSITAGGWHTCGIRTTTNEAYCWGWNGLGQIGDGSAFEHTGPVQVSGSANYTTISTGHQHTCAVPASGIGQCWGWNFYGQLGDGTTADRSTPTTVVGALTFTQIVSGAFHSCGLATGGAAYCWGYNASGQLGNGTTTSSSSPVLVSGGQTFVQLSAGDDHTCGRTAGWMYCWGENGEGQLGNGSTTDSPMPVPPTLTATFRSVSAGGQVTCAVEASSNAAYCWGNNQAGSLGNGTTTNSLTPATVSGGLAFSTVVAGFRHVCGLTTGNEVYCWGRNNAGQLGIGSTSNSSTPSKVSGTLSWKAVSASRDENACGVTSTDLAYCWGGNFFGQLGDGTIVTGASTPKQVLATLAFRDLQSGDAHTCGIIPTTNLAFCWGDNQRGQLGNGTTTTRLTPVAVLTGPASVPPIASSEPVVPVVEAERMLDRRAWSAPGRTPGVAASKPTRLR